ncbi:hypothetical protein B296_00016167 [Ensete ventricosum]|uniref:POX domain-containing protein n=1 Tax=Ensete ventricosum TaxID=4639 RepID=A0A426ZJZ3_ENSVE|nr:hypothetical protein B296_00016167 [Ensete ventricosum]
MATYFHGAPEIQPDGLQTLYLMNPSYVGYTDAAAPANMVLLNSTMNSVNSINLAQTGHQQHFVGIPLQPAAQPHDSHRPPPIHASHDVPAVQGLLPRPHYNLWTTATSNNPVDMASQFGHWRTSTAPSAQQGLSLSLSPHEMVAIAPEITSMSAANEVKLAASASMASGAANGASGLQSFLIGTKYLKAAQQLLDEVVNVGKGINDEAAKGVTSKNPADSNNVELKDPGAGTSESNTSAKRGADLTTADRQELQVKKAKLINMLEEVMESNTRTFFLVACAFDLPIYLFCFPFGQSEGGTEVQTVPPPNANRGLFIRSCCGLRISKNIHRARPSDDIKAIPVSPGRYHRPNSRNQQDSGRGRLQVGRLEASVHRSSSETAAGTPTARNDPAECLEASERTAGALCFHSPSLALRTLPPPVMRLWKPMVEEMYMEELKDQEQNNSEENASKSDANGSSTSKSNAQQEGSPTGTAPSDSLKIDPNQTLAAAVQPSSFAHGQSPAFHDKDAIEQPSMKKAKRHVNSLAHSIGIEVKPDETNNHDILMKLIDGRQRGGEEGYPLISGNTSHGGSYGGAYPIGGELGRFDAEQFAPRFSGNGVSLTLGLQHSESLPLSGAQPSFLSSESMQLGRRMEMNTEAGDYCSLNNNAAVPHSSNAAAFRAERRLLLNYYQSS